MKEVLANEQADFEQRIGAKEQQLTEATVRFQSAEAEMLCLQSQGKPYKTLCHMHEDIQSWERKPHADHTLSTSTLRYLIRLTEDQIAFKGMTVMGGQSVVLVSPLQ